MVSLVSGSHYTVDNGTIYNPQAVILGGFAHPPNERDATGIAGASPVVRHPCLTSGRKRCQVQST